MIRIALGAIEEGTVELAVGIVLMPQVTKMPLVVRGWRKSVG